MKLAKNDKKLALVIVMVIILVVGGAIIFFVFKQNSSCESIACASGAKQPQIISGKVDGVSNQCQADGICGVTLDNGKTIITGCGLMAGGKTCKTYDQTKLKYGEHIEATVVQTETDTYTLECDTCTIRTGD
jgi:flagellar basal body-associated protein FliL